jgi:membrane associated rhomboid family serine protease
VKTEDPLGGLPGPPAPEPGFEPDRPASQRRRIPATPTTVLLLAVLGAGYAAQVALGKGEWDVDAFRLGSLNPAAVLQGDWYRLGSYAFLHGGAPHLLVNAWALWALMRPIEAALGPFAALGIFSGTAIGGGAASFGWNVLRGHPLQSAVGASGGIFGLFGAHCAIYLRVRKYLPPEARAQAARPLVYNLLINLALAIGAVAGGLPLDNAAHVGGFLSGMAFGAIASVPTLLPPRPWNRSATILFTLCAFALASMEGAAVASAVRQQPRILHAEGAEAVVPWQVLEVEPGVAETFDREFEVQLQRSGVPARTVQSKPVLLGSQEWEERLAVDSRGFRYIELVQPPTALLVRVVCLRDQCAEDRRDDLAKEVASHARTTGPP